MSKKELIKSEKALQRLTVSELLEKEEITKSDITHLSKAEVSDIKNQIFDKVSETDGNERDKYLKQVNGILTNNQRNYLYEFNHRLILGNLHNHVLEHGTIPSVSQLAKKTDLSRQTVNKHMKEYKTSDIYKEDEQKFEILAGSVLAVVFKMSMQHDLKACKLFLEYTKQSTPNNIGTYIDKQQNNFNTVLTPEVISQLSPQQIIDIEAVIINDKK